MSVYTENAKAGPFTADGACSTYPFAFPVTEGSHVAVYVDDALVTGYTTEVGSQGGSIVFDTPPAKGARIAILRQVPFTQEVDLQNNTAFYPEVLETAFDKLTMICQQIAEKVTRTLTVKPTDPKTPEQVLSELYNAQSIAGAEADRAERAANTALTNGEKEVQKAKYWAEVAKDTVVSGDITYDELGSEAIITPDVVYEEDEILYDVEEEEETNNG